MPKKTSLAGSELFIVDNSDEDWKAARYLRDWCQLSKSIDIATGYFEIGALLALDGEWQKVDGIRLLMGDEVSRRTKKAFDEGLARVANRLDQSIEGEKRKNDFLDGVVAIVEAIRSGAIQCRVYRKDKFHAKAYITHARLEVIGSSALVGSSNFTHPGLTQNIELNVQITGAPVSVLQEWYDAHWDAAEDVTPELLKVIERHIQDYTPFEVYAKSLHEFFKGHELTATEWERNHSAIYKILAPYQREGYHAMLKRADRWLRPRRPSAMQAPQSAVTDPQQASSRKGSGRVSAAPGRASTDPRTPRRRHPLDSATLVRSSPVPEADHPPQASREAHWHSHRRRKDARPPCTHNLATSASTPVQHAPQCCAQTI